MRVRTVLLSGFAGVLLASAAAAAADLEQRENRAYADPGAAAVASTTALPDQALAKRLADELGVRVLGMTPTGAKDPPIYAVRVMNPAGNANGALLVSTLLVDASTGKILGQARPAPSAADPDLMPLSRTPEDADGGRDLRRRTFETPWAER
jgi:hypothetical protein